MKNEIRIFSGNANPELAEAIAKELGINLGKIFVNTFSDGEIRVKIEENVRGKDCYIIQPTCPPVNDHIMELLIIMDALLRASARRITPVIPYYGYARQDRKAEPRVPITAKLVANLITSSGADRILAMDLHAGQIQGFFDIPVDHLYANPVFLNYFKNKKFMGDKEYLCVVSPDAGGVERARAFAKRLEANLVIIDKRRSAPNQSSIMHIIGDVKGKTAIMLDDLIDTGGSLINAATALKKEGVKRVLASCSHGVLSGNAIERIEKSDIEKLIITDTIPLRRKSEKIVVLSVDKLLADAIKRIHNEESVSTLFV
ncbi:MAG: ribose-phosphate pyrophosphokinase [Elusimicrobia bacterium]|nr:ribose-phosphate pyrophosphokinase [Elusimicrobiota bacterium]MBU2614282.1 ribose-phosphate pyrophosphokinase [Elusimicrobiota bacterium]